MLSKVLQLRVMEELDSAEFDSALSKSQETNETMGLNLFFSSIFFNNQTEGKWIKRYMHKISWYVLMKRHILKIFDKKVLVH